jgi:hypothetical protein
MPTNENAKQMTGDHSKTNGESSFRRSTRKTPGTRVGTLEDWRSADKNGGKISGRHGCAIRDGR